MRRRRSGAVVNVSSTCGLVGCRGLTAYCTTKGAVLQMTRAMAMDCATDGVRVNAVCPGATDTPMLFSAHKVRPTRPDMERAQEVSVPMQRMAEFVRRGVTLFQGGRHDSARGAARIR